MRKSETKPARNRKNNNSRIFTEDMEFALGERELELPGPVTLETEKFIELLALIPENKLPQLMRFASENATLPITDAVNIRLLTSEKYYSLSYAGRRS
ncbi:MAG: hypothetical protein A2017_09220 [Lentisphaerae bacterium GWF2_44_16]|nr:MAG: hypothetical protein A2017_09220 [Lentisphaerae bacterium GWF2_44_16]